MKGKRSVKWSGVFIIVIFMSILSSQVSAEIRWIEESISTDLSMIMRDDIRNRIYLADSGNGQLVIIDSESEEILERIPVGQPITDMAMSKDERWLDVVGGGVANRIDLNRLKINKSYNIPDGAEGKAIRSIAFDYKGFIYAVALNGDSEYDYRSEIYVLNSSLKKVVVSFGVGPNLTSRPYKALLKTDSVGTILYVGEKGLSPLSIYKINILNTKAPKYLGEDAHGALGSNLKDIAISPRFDEIYVASGAPYGIQVVNAETMELVTLLETGPYPAGLEVGPLGDKVYGIPGSPYNNYLYEFDAIAQTLIHSYVLESQVHNGQPQDRGIALDRFGEKVFIIHGDDHPSYREMKVQVVDLLP